MVPFVLVYTQDTLSFLTTNTLKRFTPVLNVIIVVQLYVLLTTADYKYQARGSLLASDTYQHVLFSSATITGDVVHPTRSQSTAMDESASGSSSSSSSSLQTTAAAAVKNLNSVKRNLFGSAAAPTKATDPVIDGISLPLINFSFHSPVKREDVMLMEDISIHDSVSSAMNQLPPLGSSDKSVEDSRTCDAVGYEQDCAEDDQWLEGISSSQWGEGHAAELPCMEVGMAKLQRYVVLSVTLRQQLDQQDGIATRFV